MWSIEEIRQLVRKMIERESRGNGDQLNAMDRVGEMCRMQPRALRRLINAETKGPSMRDVNNILSAYHGHLSSMISQLEAEKSAFEERAAAISLGPIDEEIAALAERLRVASEKAKQGR